MIHFTPAGRLGTVIAYNCSAKSFMAASVPGFYGMLMYVIIAVFIAGLMVGRTPEYLGKKINAFEMKMASIAILITPFWYWWEPLLVF